MTDIIADIIEVITDEDITVLVEETQDIISVETEDGGGTYAASIRTDTTNFDHNLSSADDTVQKALETLDEITDLQVPGGSNTSIQYNDSGSFGGDSNLTWDKINKVLGINGLAAYTTSPTFTLDTQLVDKKYVDDQVGGENHWDRAGTVLSPHASGDSVKIGDSLILRYDVPTDSTVIEAPGKRYGFLGNDYEDWQGWFYWDVGGPYSNAAGMGTMYTAMVCYESHANSIQNATYGTEVVGNIFPQTTNTYDLGTSSLMWKDGYFSRALYAPHLYTWYVDENKYNWVGGMDSEIAFEAFDVAAERYSWISCAVGGIDMGTENDGDPLYPYSNIHIDWDKILIHGNTTPDITNAYDLGSSAYAWKDGWFAGNLYAPHLYTWYVDENKYNWIGSGIADEIAMETVDVLAGLYGWISASSGMGAIHMGMSDVNPPYDYSGIYIYLDRIDIHGSMQPDTTNLYDLGNTDYKWKDGYFAGNVILGGLTPTADINLGAYDLTATDITATNLYGDTVNAGTFYVDGIINGFSPNDAVFDRVYTRFITTYTNVTTEAGTTKGTPFTVLPSSAYYLFVGKYEQFSDITFDFASFASSGDVGLTLEFYYYSSTTSAWTLFDITTDGTAAFTQNGTITFSPPADWETAKPHTSSDYLYYIYIRSSSSSLTDATVYSVTPNIKTGFAVFGNGNDRANTITPVFYTDIYGRPSATNLYVDDLYSGGNIEALANAYSTQLLVGEGADESKWDTRYFYTRGEYTEFYNLDGNVVFDLWNGQTGDACFGMRFADDMFMVGSDYTLVLDTALNMNMSREFGLGQLPVTGYKLSLLGELGIIGGINNPVGNNADMVFNNYYPSSGVGFSFMGYDGISGLTSLLSLSMTGGADFGSRAITTTGTIYSTNGNFSGNVGIGADYIASHNLYVNGSVKVGSAFNYTPSTLDFTMGSATVASRFLFGQSNSCYGGMVWNYNATATSAYLSLGYMNGTATKGLNILQDGKVGIGNIAPTEVLDVTGNIKASGTLTAPIVRGAVIAATSATAIDTAEKAVTIAGYTLTAGDTIALTLTNGNSVTAMKLNINAGGPISVYCGGTAASTITTTIAATGVITLYYDGTYFRTMGSYRTSDSDTWTSKTYGGSLTSGVAITRYKTCMEGSDGQMYPVTIGDSTDATKTVSTQTMKLDGLVTTFISSSTSAAGAQSVVHYNGYTQSTTYVSYGWNGIAHLTNYKPIYFVGTVDANGYFVFDNSSYTSYCTSTLPSTEDGKVYIQVGHKIATTLYMEPYHPIYEYKNGKVQPYRASGLADGENIVLGTTTGTKIGTSTSQKLGFYNATPVDQPATVADAATQDLTGTDTVDKTKLEADLTSCKNAVNYLIDRIQELGLVA